jgi:hypothetical protein
VLFDETCRLALAGSPDEALRSLEEAAGLDRLRRSARTDPWFEPIRGVAGDGTSEQRWFWRIVGDPPDPPRFLDLPSFGERADRLRAMGLDTAEAVAAATSTDQDCWQLAWVLGTPNSVVRRWRDMAELAVGTGLEVGTVQLLAEAGIASPKDLADVRERGGGRDVMQKITGAARSGERPLGTDEVQMLTKALGLAAPVSGVGAGG